MPCLTTVNAECCKVQMGIKNKKRTINHTDIHLKVLVEKVFKIIILNRLQSFSSAEHLRLVMPGQLCGILYL